MKYVKTRKRFAYKIISSALVISMLSSYSAGAKFVDLSGYSWAEQAINDMADLGILNGVGDNKFSPQGNVTRQEFLAMVLRAFGGEEKISELAQKMSEKAQYEDKSLYTLSEAEKSYGEDNWSNEILVASQYFDNIEKLWACDLSQWGEKATRAEMAFIMMTVAEGLGNEKFEIKDGINSVIGDFSDVITSQFGYYIMQAYSNGILVGVDDSGSYKPNNFVTRAETACAMQRLVDTQKRKNIDVDKTSNIISVKPNNIDEVTAIFKNIIMLEQDKVELDTSNINWKYGYELDLKNAYYAVLSDSPSLKYAYDVSFKQDANKITCTFSYMPYKLNAYKNGIPEGAYEISSLKDITLLTNNMIDGTTSKKIAITNPDIDVDDIQRTLLQCGYGFIVYTLNKDATEIVATCNTGVDSLSESVLDINESFNLAKSILEKIINDKMTDMEKIQAIYKYITTTVKYDWRYYNDIKSMPFISTTALGALRDNTAICGGYSWAMKTMLDYCGIENYTVSGKLGNESHAWNYIILNGKGYYCDPTSDRTGGDYWFMLSRDELDKKGNHTWNGDFYERLADLNN